MVDFFMALGAVNGAIKAVSDLRTADKEFAAAEFKLKIAELTSALADLKMTLTDAKEESDVKDRELTKLREALTRRSEETVVLKGYRYLKDENGIASKRPFCPVCEQKDGALIPLQWSSKPGRGDDCPRCGATFYPGA